jgi:predicted TPR repeat methyltransferase
MSSELSAAWDAEYASGRYQSDKPVRFVKEIISAIRSAGLSERTGLYVGCGNGRNFVPLTAAGLDVIGLDVSQVALEQLAARMPGCQNRLIHGDLSALPPSEMYAFVIGIQVFQHGDMEQAHRHLREALARVAVGGLFCLRVNSADTEIRFAHTIIERSACGGLTVIYHEGPKSGLRVHFFSADELLSVVSDKFEPITPMRLDRTQRPHGGGHWSQWEGIWRRSRY